MLPPGPAERAPLWQPAPARASIIASTDARRTRPTLGWLRRAAEPATIASLRGRPRRTGSHAGYCQQGQAAKGRHGQVPARGKSLNPRQHLRDLRGRSRAPGQHHGHQPAGEPEPGAGERSRLRAGDELGGQQHQIGGVRDDRGDARPEQRAPGRVRSPGGPAKLTAKLLDASLTSSAGFSGSPAGDRPVASGGHAQRPMAPR